MEEKKFIEIDSLFNSKFEGFIIEPESKDQKINITSNDEYKTWDYGSFRAVDRGVLRMIFKEIKVTIYANDNVIISFKTICHTWNCFDTKSKIVTKFYKNLTASDSDLITTVNTPFKCICDKKEVFHKNQLNINNIWNMAKIAKLSSDFWYRLC